VSSIEELGKPVIAAVNGYVIRLKTSMTLRV
jgi:enoyl-CoA hydratase/carnithine racemase